MRLAHKTSLIVGGNKGIGRAIAIAFAKEGADVVITYNDHKLEADLTLKEIEFYGVKARAVKLDITNSISRASCLDEVTKYVGQLNILVNSSGFYSRDAFINVSEKGFDKTFDVNFKGPYFFTQAVCKKMITDKMSGSIINISSSRDGGGMEEISEYSCSKAALTIFGRNIALELAKHQIRVNTIAPGLTKTDMHRDLWEKNPELWENRISEIPLGNENKPEDIAALAVYLASDESRNTTGSRFLIDGGRSLGVSLKSKL